MCPTHRAVLGIGYWVVLSARRVPEPSQHLEHIEGDRRKGIEICRTHTREDRRKKEV